MIIVEQATNYQVIYEDCSCVKKNIIFCDKCNNSRKFAVFVEKYDKDIVSICDKCNGCGKIKSSTGVEWCDDCGGKGYLDWLERIIKSKKKVYISGYSGTSAPQYMHTQSVSATT